VGGVGLQARSHASSALDANSGGAVRQLVSSCHGCVVVLFATPFGEAMHDAITCAGLWWLQKAQKKMLDVINSVGLSSSMLKMIERRHKHDVYLALGGMVRPCAWGRGPWWPTCVLSGLPTKLHAAAVYASDALLQ
jgi:hypothetical protein